MNLPPETASLLTKHLVIFTVPVTWLDRTDLELRYGIHLHVYCAKMRNLFYQMPSFLLVFDL